MNEKSIDIKLRSVEAPCPRCGHILLFSETEECTECHHCGYIDCDDEEEKDKGSAE